MSTDWHQADHAGPLLTALAERGRDRTLRLLSCLFFRRLASGPAQKLALNSRRDDRQGGWPALLRYTERLADAPTDPTGLDALRVIRTEIAIECQALGRLLMQHTSHQPAPQIGVPPPVTLLPRLLLVALGSLLISPPSPLAETPIDAEIYGESLPLEVPSLPLDHPRTHAERRIEIELPSQANPVAVAQALLEGLIASGIGLMLSVDGTRGVEPNLTTIMADLRIQSAEEMTLIIDGANDMGQPLLRDLMREWTDEMIAIVTQMPTMSAAWLQATGITFLDAALTLLDGDELSLAAYRVVQRRQADTIRLFAGDLAHTEPVDRFLLQRDDQRVARMAEVIYQEQRWDDLPILGDALEEAGCDDRNLLDALHATAVPFRGWWLLDALRLPCEA